MFPGFVILATFSLLNPARASGTIPQSSYTVLDLNYINLSNYDIKGTAIGFENLNVSKADLKVHLNTGDGNFSEYLSDSLVASSSNDYVFDYSTTSTTASSVVSIDLLNGSADGSLTYSFDKVYLLASQNSGSAGEDIIDGITAGLGLMSPIANQFLTGFSTLFWNSTLNNGAGGLTTFGNFALIFLGVSITFAVVKLALNLIRGKTGA